MAEEETKSLVGTLREFTLDKNWGIAKSRTENFFIANGIKKDERKRALLLNSLDDSAYQLISNLAVPKKPEEKTYVELVKLFDSHFLGAESVFAARYTPPKIPWNQLMTGSPDSGHWQLTVFLEIDLTEIC